MTTRSCAYKDCEYYYVGHENALTKGRTMFAFPKQPHRARIWHANGQVHPKIPHSQLFMCSLHFDRKFISSSKNRTLLVGEAVPYPYEESSTKPEEEPQQVASTSHESYYINLSDDELSINNVDTTSITTTLKKDLDIVHDSPPQKRPKESSIVIALEEAVKTEPKSNAGRVRAEPDNIDTTEVSVFNFKGQEYVQMSMEYYLEEKRKMAELLQDYRNALRSIKTHVSHLDL
ncbi:uncharacterized protein LOC117142649 isoform X1 [Drosophila mauritiana]|uniref:Uncharacterized protein LOC117142649 isoform X1 n=1 Tax=Drosophila mauritiana TaxID=7226 RepID=A0A6P8K1L8_DROMA|nr:uncharacterized protein LOC117142649 isoform X1 [Drosophila mauritiana]